MTDVKNTIQRLPLLCLPLLMAACGSDSSKSSQAAPVNVSAVPVVQRNVAYYEEYPATVRSLNEVELRPQVSGYITGIHFVEGQKVKKGQRLYTIDQQQPEAAYQQALANLALQQANLDKAKKDLDRYEELDKKDAIAKQQVDYARTAYATARQQVDAAEAAVKSVQTSVRYTTIEAPFDGTIGISNVRLGAAVTPGQTLLDVISSDDPMAVDIDVDQSEIYRFSQLLATSKEDRRDSTFRIKFKHDRYPNFGTLSLIDRAVDPQTGTIRVRLVFPNPQNTLRSGMSCTLQVKTDASDAVVIPYKAVNELLGEFFVYVAADGKASQTKVTLGPQVGPDIIITSGLSPGQRVVTEGTQNLREGSAITVSTDKAKTTD